MPSPRAPLPSSHLAVAPPAESPAAAATSKFPLRTFSFKLGDDTIVVNPVVTVMAFVLTWSLVIWTNRKLRGA
jgi:hypothetical protein